MKARLLTVLLLTFGLFFMGAVAPQQVEPKAEPDPAVLAMLASPLDATAAQAHTPLPWRLRYACSTTYAKINGIPHRAIVVATTTDYPYIIKKIYIQVRVGMFTSWWKNESAFVNTCGRYA